MRRLLAAATITALWPIVWGFSVYDRLKAGLASNVWED